MKSPESIRGYAAIRSAEYRSVARAEAYVQWAQDMLAAGFDSPALLSLAIADEAAWCEYCAQSFVGEGRTYEEPILEEAAKLLSVSRR